MWVALIALVLFGGAKLPSLLGGLGKGMHEFKKGIKEGDRDPEDKDPEDKDSDDEEAAEFIQFLNEDTGTPSSFPPKIDDTMVQ